MGGFCAIHNTSMLLSLSFIRIDIGGYRSRLAHGAAEVPSLSRVNDNVLLSNTDPLLWGYTAGQPRASRAPQQIVSSTHVAPEIPLRSSLKFAACLPCMSLGGGRTCPTGYAILSSDHIPVAFRIAAILPTRRVQTRLVTIKKRRVLPKEGKQRSMKSPGRLCPMDRSLRSGRELNVLSGQVGRPR